MSGKRYTLDEEQKKRFAGIYVLEYMINKPAAFDVLLQGSEADLESVLDWLMMKGWVEIKDSSKYTPSEKGRKILENFLKRYTEYLNVYDIFCAVDLASGEFAFSSYFEFEQTKEWRKFLNDERWDDLRIAVAQFKEMDPIEIVFMSYISEGRFGRNEEGWQFDLLLGTVWDEILEICSQAIHWEQLGYGEGEDAVEGEAVIEDVISQGMEIVKTLHQHEKQLANSIEHEDVESTDSNQYVEPVIIEEYIIPDDPDYYDPHYRSPYWRNRWWN